LLLLGLFAGLIGFAPSAFAHHAYLQGNVNSACDVASGKIRVNFEVKSWDTVSSGSRVLNANIGVQYRTGATSTFPTPTNPVTGFSGDVFNGAFTDNNAGGVPSFSGSFLVDASLGGQFIQLRAYPKATWINLAGDSTQPANPANDQSFVVSVDPLRTNCTPDPHATATLQCPQERIQVNLTGANSATTVDIRKNGVLVGDDVAVPVGASSFNVPLSPADENTTVTISLDYAVGTDQALTVPVDCKTPPVPSADVQWACGENATVVLGNTGQETIQATILKNGVPVFTNIDVPPGGTTRTVTIGAGDENTDVAIKVTFSDSGTATDVTETFTVDCNKPAPTIGTPVCAEGGLRVTLGNIEGEDQAVFTIVIGGVTTTQTVAAGGTFSLLIPVAEDATVSVSISSGSVSYSNQALTRDCENPQATVVFDCAEGGVVVTLTNSGVLPTHVDVNGEDVVVPAGTTAADPVIRIIAVAEGEAYDVTVLGQTASGTRDCEGPDATLVFECAAGGVVVTVTNAGELPTEVMVNGSPVTVDPGVPYTTTISVAEGASYSVTVTGDGLDKSISGTRDCERPSLTSATFDCAEGGVVVVLANSGELPATVQVDGNDVVIPAAGTTTVTVPVAENATYDFDIVIDGETTNRTGQRDCEHPAVVSATLDCAEGGVVVLLSNTGETDATVNVGGVEVTVPAGTTAADPVSVTVPVAENATYDFAVTGDELDESFSGTRDCEKPQVLSAQLECAEGGVVVVLVNDGESDTTVTVNGDPVHVPAGTTADEPVTVTVPVDENAAFDFMIEGDGIDQQVTGTRDCQKPQPSVDDEVACATGGLNLVLRNTGADAATFVITSPALPGGADEVTLGASSVSNFLIPLAEDASTAVKVASGGEVLFDKTITRDCVTVQGVVLPRTGAPNSTGLLTLVGGALLLAGTALVTGGRRRRTARLS
jgi:LPXTG-motif cell wall-anchored protein